MCMQPWFFSMGRLHLGQGLELARILQRKHSWLKQLMGVNETQTDGKRPTLTGGNNNLV